MWYAQHVAHPSPAMASLDIGFVVVLNKASHTSFPECLITLTQYYSGEGRMIILCFPNW